MNQKQAAGKLSTMERDLIGNYSNFQKRMEPEGKPTSKIVGRGQQLLNRLPGGQDHEEDLRQMRLHKFADSLMKQRANAAAAQERKLSRQNVQTSSKDSGVASNTATTVTQVMTPVISSLNQIVSQKVKKIARKIATLFYGNGEQENT